ncbi:MAG: helix-turn-helix domain-containing protein [Patescibacteria group bacterium]
MVRSKAVFDFGNVEDILTALRFSKREVKVALALLEEKSARASIIGKKTDEPRQTVYSILKRFGEQGLVTSTVRGGIRYFVCDYRHLARFIKNEQSRLKRIERSLETGLSPSVALESNITALPSVTYYEGSLGLEHLFDSMLDLYRRGKYKRFRGYGVNFLAETRGLEEYIRSFLKKRSAMGVITKLFIAKGPDDFRITDESTRLGRDIKHLDIDEQNAGIYLIGNRIYLFSFKDNVGVMVENQAIAGFMEDAFDDHWTRV